MNLHKANAETSNTKRNTVVVGDSIIKYVKGWELSDATGRVRVNSFSGANVQDMRDFIKPILRKNPDKLVLYVGTNDLRYSEPKAVGDGIANLVLKIEQQCPSIQVAVSGIIVRTDDTSVADRVRETNCMLKSLCNQNDWHFISNSNVTAVHLNYRGLHLSPSGSVVLQNNYKLAIYN